ncbi:hypothetical protein FHG89_14705 [Micromonospora orduensis]|uniref:Uncharacterized protein n=1 Tax=Micromonospora orduensis TaxID=1420891 RepID=A0A5C4QSM4_9ACTN|nr:DUF6153 family protein [Micromonospora orduensis]TNH28676.1 hypothetical protein FHG89_14705 [Micromonospora orduensis]
MTGVRAVGAGRMARWVLLACTLFGLAAMHTLGHAGMHMGTHPGHGPAGAVAVAGGMDVPADVAAAVTAVTGECPGCAHVSGPQGPGRDGMPGWSVCLAVLTGLAVLVLLTAWWWARPRPVGSQTRNVSALSRVSRGPPRPVGLSLARLSVLRT